MSRKFNKNVVISTDSYFILFLIIHSFIGLGNDGNTPVIVLGATNRPSDIDPAFLRRMPFQICTIEPNVHARRDILLKMLKDDKISEDVDINEIALLLEGYTGSDIKEVLRLCSLNRMKTVIRGMKERDGESPGTPH